LAAHALIINGDDFGSSEAVNRAILHAYREGVLTSASLMVNEPAAQQAVEIAREHPGLAVGLHLSLVLGRSALQPEEIPHLVNSRGVFSLSPFRAGMNYYFSPPARREVRREMRAQFEKFAATGLAFSHVDGHNHLHMHPVVFDELVRLCEEFNVRRLRVVRSETSVHFQITRRNWPGKLVLGGIFGLLGRACARRLANRGFVTPQMVYGLLQTGDLNEDYLLELLARIDQASAEVYLHPLAADADEEERRDNPGGTDELGALLSLRVRRTIETRGFRLATYATL